MVSSLRACAKAGKLKRLTRVGEIDKMLDQLMNKDWVVYSKPSIDRPQAVISYLARYSHKIAISDHRLIGMTDDQVHFRYKDYRDGQPKVMKLHCDEFIRRFLLHVLPKGFMRIRHYGFLANRCRKAALALIRKILVQPVTVEEQVESEALKNDGLCPKCHQGHLLPIRVLKPLWLRSIMPVG